MVLALVIILINPDEFNGRLYDYICEEYPFLFINLLSYCVGM